jgi:Family of unknown function (DUF5694)
MNSKLTRFAGSWLLVSSQVFAADHAPATPPIEVMIVGVFHMSNPGRDLHNVKVDDMQGSKRQTEIASVTDALARFKPNKVGVEWPEDVVAGRYKEYLNGTLPPSNNEVVQLGFRLAKSAKSEGVYSLDADGNFPYERVRNFAASHGLTPLLEGQSAMVEREIAEQTRVLNDRGVGAALRFLNEPNLIINSNGFYRTMLRVGAGEDQPGADLLAAWYHRNFLICANLIQLAKPGDHIVVFFGSGHALLLRQCVTEMPGFKLIEPNDYLPR